MLYFRLENGERKYTLDPEGAETAIPAKYSVGDRFSDERVTMKRRFNIFPFDEQ